MGDFPAEYVELLNAAWREAGSPTMRELSEQLGIPFSTVNNYLTGRNRPAPPRLRLLADHLCGEGTDAYDHIVDAYDRDLAEASIDFSGPRWRRAPGSPPTAGPRAEATRELTAAIRELTAATKEQTASYDSMLDQLRLLAER